MPSMRASSTDAFSIHLGHVGTRGLEDVPRGSIAFEGLAIPLHDLGRQEADETDLDGVGLPRPIHAFLVDDHIGIEERLSAPGVAPSSNATLALTTGKSAPAMDFMRKSRP